MMLFPPLIEEPSIAERQVFARLYAETRRHAIDPLGFALKLGEIADGRLVDYTVPFPIAPLGAPLFVAKRFYQPERAKDSGQCISIGHDRLRLDAVLVPVFPGHSVRQPLVGHNTTDAVVANAHNLRACTQGAVGCVVKNIALKLARRLKMKSSSL